jgi:Trk K+ transport system NAD-binding subunit
MTELGRSGDVQEVEVTDESLASKTISDVNETLPEGCIVALVSRDEENTVPEASLNLEYGDHLTILGRTEAVHEAIDQLHPHD